MSDTASPSSKAPKARSPAFPFIPLGAAVERLEQLEAMFTRHPVPAAKAGLAWDMKEGSSQSNQTLAALKYYGFIEYHGSSNARQAVITDRGRRYLRAQQQSIKDEVLKEAALSPKAIADRWQRWGADRAPDAVCLDELILNDGFTDGAAENFLHVYDETISYAGLGKDDTLSGVTEEPEEMQQDHQHDTSIPPKFEPTLPPPGAEMFVALNGDRLQGSFDVDLKGARRLLKAIKANLVLLQDDDDGEAGE